MRELLTPKTTTAMEIAILVKALPDLTHGADLIEQYARTAAAAARLEASEQAYCRVQTLVFGEEKSNA